MLLNFARRILGHSSLLQLMERHSCNMQQYARLVLRHLHCYVISVWLIYEPWV